ncbi:MAG: hypothetical protein F6K53_20140 [Moorea sp. SIO4A1]|uniref:hypothetical protein n=1 Tax=Moorena sp. SIO4A1 TaxID=2607835 RepID=UPI001418F197|nr:hypothetical protein [Moorena sp. SIO4A1]NEO43289.1 hypothetical protein [Moorena sp. SIO4A3]NEQ59582.1 hypothetical protein [Moorena sp. SIO4A1]
MSTDFRKKKQKRIKGVPAHYDEMKLPHNLRLTDSTWNLLRKKAASKGLSVSEMIEQWVRNWE